MSKKVPIWLTVTLVLLAGLISFQTTYVLTSEKYETEIREQTVNKASVYTDTFSAKLKFIDALYRQHYYGKINDEELLDGILKGYVEGTGDEYGAYYTAEEFEELTKDNNAELEGIGVSVIENTDYDAIEVINVMPDSPALEAGIQIGDLIVEVGEERESVAELGYTAAVNKIRGKADTYATFTVYRGKNYSEKVDFKIKRGYVTEQTVMYHAYEKDTKIGIVKVLQFDAGTPKQFFEAIEKLGAAGVEKFVFDMRNNPGGELTSVTQILDFLLPEGPIIRMKDVTGKEDMISSDANEFNAPMVVLVNKNTASAAELFSSALKDYNKAKLVGVKTYGKGSMQQLLPFTDGTGLRMTYKMYFPPFSEGYNGIGIFPDIEVELDEALKTKNVYKISDDEDNQLQAAIESLSK